MSDMVECVAKAIVTAMLGDERGWEQFTDEARAAIKAMREPNRKMLIAMCVAMSPERRPTPERVSSNEKHRIRWRAAIDTALAKSGHSGHDPVQGSEWLEIEDQLTG